MRKQVLAFSFVFVGFGALAFLLIRAERIIQRQQRSLKDLSAKVERLERASASAASSTASNGSIFNLEVASDASEANLKSEVDQLHRTVTDLQTRLNEVQRQSQVYRVAGAGQNGNAANPTFRVVPDSALMPSQQMPPGSVPFEFNGATYYRIPLAFKN